MAHEEHAVVMEPVATAGASHGQAILEQEPAKIEAADLSFYYGDKQALKRVSIRMMPKEVTALIGPSGCGKSTFLRCINRMNDRIAGTRVEGQVRVDGFDVYAPDVDPVVLRKSEILFAEVLKFRRLAPCSVLKQLIPARVPELFPAPATTKRFKIKNTEMWT